MINSGEQYEGDDCQPTGQTLKMTSREINTPRLEHSSVYSECISSGTCLTDAPLHQFVRINDE